MAALTAVVGGNQIVITDLNQVISYLNANYTQQFTSAGGSAILSGQGISKTFTFPTAYTAIPAVSASCQTTGSVGNVPYAVITVSTTAVQVNFLNNDSSTQTLSNFSIIAVGPVV